jgi:hypothetical protein
MMKVHALLIDFFLSGSLGHLTRYAPRDQSSKYYSTPAAGRGRKPCICGKITRSKGH